MKEIDINKLSEKLVHSLTESLYSSGFFTDEDIKNKKSLALAFKKLIVNGGLDEMAMTVDHTQSLISKARYYRKSNEYNFSKIFYATFFEHQVNLLIHVYCLRNKIDTKNQMSIIQSVNIWSKLTWLLLIMGYPKIKKDHLNTIKTLADSRNAFVHYKWKEDTDFHKIINSEKKKNEINNEFEKIEKAVKYFKRYCSKIHFKGNKGRIKEITKPDKTDKEY